MKFRTPLKKAKGNGSAKAGTGHWISQRVTAIMLIPLTLLFMVFFIKLVIPGDYETIASVLSNPFWLTCVLLFVIVGFYHGALGMQVIIEDYISDEMRKIVLLVVMRLAALFFATMAVISILKIALAASI